MKCDKCEYDFKFPSVIVLNDNYEYKSFCPKCANEIQGYVCGKSKLNYYISRYKLDILLN